MWHQAECNAVTLASLNGNGVILKDGKSEILWDTPENIQTVRQNVRLLINGCGCKSGCRTGRCSCKKITPEIVVLDVAALTMKTHKMLHNRRKMNWSELKGNNILCKVLSKK